MGRDTLVSWFPQPIKRFNPRARMGRDFEMRGTTARHLVSIHAPAWGATIKLQNLFLLLLVSIHAPAWGATYSNCKSVVVSDRFNPRARMGRDLQYGA